MPNCLLPLVCPDTGTGAVNEKACTLETPEVFLNGPDVSTFVCRCNSLSENFSAATATCTMNGETGLRELPSRAQTRKKFYISLAYETVFECKVASKLDRRTSSCPAHWRAGFVLQNEIHLRLAGKASDLRNRSATPCPSAHFSPTAATV